MSEDSSGEAELEAEPETSDQEDVRDLHPGALLYKASKARNLPVMAEALAHGADVNLVNEEDEGKTPLIQAVIGVSGSFTADKNVFPETEGHNITACDGFRGYFYIIFGLFYCYLG